jgi:glycosyltransferase involved in cell wall biosynthesis
MLDQLVELRDRYGWDVTAIIASGDGSLRGKLEARGIRTVAFDFEFPSRFRLHRLPRTVLALTRHFDLERYDVAQTHLFNSMVLGRLAAWLADVPVRLAMVAGPFHLEAETPRWVDADTAWMDTGIIGSCAYTNALYRSLGVPERKLHLVYYGPNATTFDPSKTQPADLRAEFGWPADAPIVGMVAYFYPKLPPSRWTPRQLHAVANKRHEDLLRAVGHVLRKHPEVRFVLVGSGWGPDGEAQLAAMQALADELGLRQAVAFAGYRSDVARTLQAFDVSVQASLSENLGGTIESLLMERPLVATRVGGMVDSVHDETTGLLVPPLDPEALARAICRLLDDPAWAKTLGQAGRRLMLSQFTLEQTVAALDAIYRKQLAGDGVSRRHGFRTARRLLRRCVAIGVFAYLGGRLAWDLAVLRRLDSLRDRLRRARVRRGI